MAHMKFRNHAQVRMKETSLLIVCLTRLWLLDSSIIANEMSPFVILGGSGFFYDLSY